MGDARFVLSWKWLWLVSLLVFADIGIMCQRRLRKYNNSRLSHESGMTGSITRSGMAPDSGAVRVIYTIEIILSILTAREF